MTSLDLFRVIGMATEKCASIEGLLPGTGSGLLPSADFKDWRRAYKMPERPAHLAM
ncbi:MAG: hypothetical protein WB762_26780 [Candidatus Sulfotelmatobacter sp.]